MDFSHTKLKDFSNTSNHLHKQFKGFWSEIKLRSASRAVMNSMTAWQLRQMMTNELMTTHTYETQQMTTQD